MSKNIYTTTLRMNLDNPADRAAWEHLQRLDRTQYRSVSRAVVAAVNAFFDRQERLASDPYLETREKEDAFLQRVLDTIREGLRESGADGLGSLAALLRSTEPARTPDAAPGTEEDLDAAMEFVNSL